MLPYIACSPASSQVFEARANRGSYALLFMQMELGYFVSGPKSTLFPVQRMVHLGLGIDSSKMAFFLPDRLRTKFRLRREQLLSDGTATEKQIQSFIGKCNHLKSVFPASHLFTFHCRDFVSRLDDTPAAIPAEVLDEIRFWSFVDSHTEPIPFRPHRHLRLELFTDASGSGFGATVNLPSGPVVIRDYWVTDLLSEDICVKETLAVLLVLQALPESVWSRRVDVGVDNEGLSLAWAGLKASSGGLARVLRELFLFCVDLNVDLRLHWVSTSANPADAPSRVLSRGDARLSDSLRVALWEHFGPFSWDLMALPSNAFEVSGQALPFFSPFPVPGSAGVDVFSQPLPEGVLYAYPPFVMIPALIGFLEECGDARVVLVLPFDASSPAPAWFSRLAPFVLDRMPLVLSHDLGSVLFPSSQGYVPNRFPLSCGLAAFKCYFPPRLVAPAPALSVLVRVLVVADSMFRPFASLVWSAPFSVKSVSISGASLTAVVNRACILLSAGSFDVLLFHAGINDVSRAGVDFASEFRSACASAVASLASFSSTKIFCSGICQTKSSALNVRVRSANDLLRSVSEASGWHFVSNDYIHYQDLSDEVHLNAAGVAKFFRRLSFTLRSVLV